MVKKSQIQPEPIWAGAMMLQHPDHQNAHDTIMMAIENILREQAYLTPYMGGKGNTEELGKATEAAIWPDSENCTRFINRRTIAKQ